MGGSKGGPKVAGAPVTMSVMGIKAVDFPYIPVAIIRGNTDFYAVTNRCISGRWMQFSSMFIEEFEQYLTLFLVTFDPIYTTFAAYPRHQVFRNWHVNN